MQIKQIVVGDLGTNCYLLESRGKLVIIDPGGNIKKILEIIKNKTSRLKYIVNTHYHEDHTREDEKLRQATGAKILIHAAEKDLIDFRADWYLREGDIIGAGNIKLKVIHTPGHTPGGICLLDDANPAQGARFIFTGDTLFLNGVGRTDLEWGSEEDMKRSLRRLAIIIKPGMIVYPGHGDYSEFTG